MAVTQLGKADHSESRYAAADTSMGDNSSQGGQLLTGGTTVAGNWREGFNSEFKGQNSSHISGRGDDLRIYFRAIYRQ